MAEEIDIDGFRAYWDDSSRVIASKADLRDYWTRIHSQAPEKVTTTDLYYLRSMDEGTVNVPYLLAQYLFRHAEGRKQGARKSGGYFVALVHDLTMIDMDDLANEEIPEEGVQADPAPKQEPQASPVAPAPRTMSAATGRELYDLPEVRRFTRTVSETYLTEDRRWSQHLSSSTQPGPA
ncbi:hypothetical protein Tco_1277603 [Tanacetum coccineum]